jgi:hypothetical protein
MNCWGIRIYFTKSRFLLNGGYIVYMELLSGHKKIITKSGISLNVGTLNRGFTVHYITLLQNSLVFVKELESSLLAKLLLDDSNSKSGRGEGHGGRF